MKKIFYVVLPFLGILAGCSPIVYTNNTQLADDQSQQGYSDQPVTDQVFYDELSPYGQWIDYPDYGYVWQPDVDADFRPYDTNGSWVYSDEGWTWASDYSWGWAPFHYGRWFYDDSFGWLWMPGHEWAPAWVTWSQSGDYYGWAAMPPRTSYTVGWRPRNNEWNFVPARNIATSNVHSYVVRNNITVVNNITFINNINNNNTNKRNNGKVIYNRGPGVADVENAGHTKIQRVKISGNARPGQSLNNNQFNIYRPAIQQSLTPQNVKPVPKKVAPYNQNGNQNPNRQNPAGGNGQSGNQNPKRQNPAGGNGQGGNQNPNYQNPAGGNGQGGNQNPDHQNPVGGNGQGGNQNPNHQNPADGNGQGGNQNPSHPNPVGGNGQGGNQNPSHQNPVGGNGQGGNPDTNPKNQQQFKKDRQPANNAGDNTNTNQQRNQQHNKPAAVQGDNNKVNQPQLKKTVIMTARPAQQPARPVQQQPRPVQNINPPKPPAPKIQPPKKLPPPPVKPQGN